MGLILLIAIDQGKDQETDHNSHSVWFGFLYVSVRFTDAHQVCALCHTIGAGVCLGRREHGIHIWENTRISGPPLFKICV